MIKDYNIKMINNEEVLYLYLDFNSEFANLNKKNNKKLKQEVEEYIKKNRIDFKGYTIAIIVGGIMMGTLILNKPEKDRINSYLSSSNSNIVSIIDNVDFVNVEQNIIDKEQSENIEEEDIDVEKVQIENNNINKTTVKKDVEVNNNENLNKDINISTKVEESKEENKDEIYVKVYRTNGDVLRLELEEYLVGVVGAEMPASFNKEALKAQAIVARTYTLRALESGKNLTDNSSTQNYKSNIELKTLWENNYNAYFNKIKNAVESTKGMFLTYDGEYVDAVYHSTSNGYTEDSRNVWGNNVPYLISVSSEYDNTNKSFVVKTFFTYDTISEKLNNIVSSETNFNIISRNFSGRVSEIEINGNTYNGVFFRNLLGLRSADFEIEKLENGVNIITKGYGHGVGMSQYGANGMANNGYSFKDILLHYYSGVNLNYNL